MYDSLEGARQFAKGLMKLEEWAKKNTPKGKKYKGIKFRPFNNKTGFGYRAIPVFERESKK